MKSEQTLSSVEIYCQRCRVTFPLNARQCLHCGGRLSKTRGAPPVLFEPEPSALPPMPPPLDRPDEDTPRRSGISPVSILWIAVAVAVGVQRACAS